MSEVLKQVAEEAANDVEVQSQTREDIDLDRLATDSEDAPVIKIVNLILAQAIKEKASDIHIELSGHSVSGFHSLGDCGWEQWPNDVFRWWWFRAIWGRRWRWRTSHHHPELIEANWIAILKRIHL